MVSRYFDVQMEEYLLRDSQRCDRAAVHKTEVQYHEAQVMAQGNGIEREWLTITGVVADALIDGQEIIYTSYKKSDGSFKEAEILQVRKWNGETQLIYQESRVILERLIGKNLKKWEKQN